MKTQDEFRQYVKDRWGGAYLKNDKLPVFTIAHAHQIFLDAYALGQNACPTCAARMYPVIPDWKGAEIFIPEPEPTVFAHLVPNHNATNAIAGEQNRRGVK